MSAIEELVAANVINSLYDVVVLSAAPRVMLLILGHAGQKDNKP
jgi:hypothetical protein